MLCGKRLETLSCKFDTTALWVAARPSKCNMPNFAEAFELADPKAAFFEVPWTKAKPGHPKGKRSMSSREKRAKIKRALKSTQPPPAPVPAAELLSPRDTDDEYGATARDRLKRLGARLLVPIGDGNCGFACLAFAAGTFLV